MKKVEILQMFRDKDAFNKVYTPGTTVEFNDERAAILAAKGLVKIVADVKEVPVSSPAPKNTEVPAPGKPGEKPASVDKKSNPST